MRRHHPRCPWLPRSCRLSRRCFLARRGGTLDPRPCCHLPSVERSPRSAPVWVPSLPAVSCHLCRSRCAWFEAKNYSCHYLRELSCWDQLTWAFIKFAFDSTSALQSRSNHGSHRSIWAFNFTVGFHFQLVQVCGLAFSTGRIHSGKREAAVRQLLKACPVTPPWRPSCPKYRSEFSHLARISIFSVEWTRGCLSRGRWTCWGSSDQTWSIFIPQFWASRDLLWHSERFMSYRCPYSH